MNRKCVCCGERRDRNRVPWMERDLFLAPVLSKALNKAQWDTVNILHGQFGLIWNPNHISIREYDGIVEMDIGHCTIAMDSRGRIATHHDGSCDPSYLWPEETAT